LFITDTVVKQDHLILFDWHRVRHDGSPKINLSRFSFKPREGDPLSSPACKVQVIPKARSALTSVEMVTPVFFPSRRRSTTVRLVCIFWASWDLFTPVCPIAC
jgi:hypothetical protein